MLKYSVTMAIRLLCIVVCFFVPGYWVIIPAIGAIVLPYIAVVLANVSSSGGPGLVSPGQLALPPPVHEASDHETSGHETDERKEGSP